MIRGVILLQPGLCLSVFLDLLSDPSIWVLRWSGTNAAVLWEEMSHDYHISDLVWKKEKKAREEQKEDGEFCFTPSCAVPFLWTQSFIQVSGFKEWSGTNAAVLSEAMSHKYDISDLVWKGEKGKTEEQGKILIFGQIGFICSRSFGWQRAESKGALP